VNVNVKESQRVEELLSKYVFFFDGGIVCVFSFCKQVCKVKVSLVALQVKLSRVLSIE